MVEDNQVKWRGIRPVEPLENIQVHLGPWEGQVGSKSRVQIKKSVEGNNNTTIIHTVTSGKKFYLCSCHCAGDNGNNQETHLSVRDDGDTLQYAIIGFTASAATPMNEALTFNPPLEIAAGFDVVLITDAGHADGFVFGWEE